VVRIEPVRVVVEPGGQVPVTVTVRNTSQIVEGFRLTVHGAPAAWADIVTGKDPGPDESDVVRAYPGAESTATIIFTAPAAGSGVAGSVAFCVLATSVVDPTCSAAAEGDLEVGRVDGLAASITPVTSSGRWSGRHAVKVSNWGNSAVSLRVVASDPDEALGYLVHPDRLDLPVGASAFAAVRVRSRKPFLRGQPVRLPFRVIAEPDPPIPSPAEPTVPSTTAAPAVSSPARPVLDGALNQKPVLSKGAVALGALAAVGMATAVVIAVTAEPVPAQEIAVNADVDPPTGVTATALDQTSIRVNWTQAAQEPDGFRVFLVDRATLGQQPPATQKVDEAPGSVNQHDFEGLTPDTEFCVQVAAVRGESQSPRSTEEACARTDEAIVEPTVGPSPTGPTPTETTASPTQPTGTTQSTGTTETTEPTDSTSTGSPTPTASPSPTESGLPSFGDQWVLYWPFPQDDRNQGPLMDRRREELEQQDVVVGELDSTDYPDLSARFTGPQYLLYVGPFPSKADATAACAEKQLPNCEAAVQPGDPG
jgi:hypothetical protein